MLAVVPSASAGNLDIDYLRPSPAKAFMYSAVLPGGGFFYLAEKSKNPHGEYKLRGMLYLVLTAGAAVFTISQINKDLAGGAAVGTVGFVALRLMEFGDVIDDAETDRHQALKEALRSEQAQSKKADTLPGVQ